MATMTPPRWGAVQRHIWEVLREGGWVEIRHGVDVRDGRGGAWSASVRLARELKSPSGEVLRKLTRDQVYRAAALGILAIAPQDIPGGDLFAGAFVVRIGPHKDEPLREVAPEGALCGEGREAKARGAS